MALWSQFYNHQLLLLAFLHVEKIGFNSQQNKSLKNIFASSLTLAGVDESRFWPGCSDSGSKWICPTSIWKRLNIRLEHFERQGE